MLATAVSGNAMARQEEQSVENAFTERPFKARRKDRRADPVLGALVDVAISYRENLGCRVAEAFLRETGVPDALVRRVLDRSARQRSVVPRRRIQRAVQDQGQCQHHSAASALSSPCEASGQQETRHAGLADT